MYQIRSIRVGKSSSSCLENAILGLRSVGKLPGKFASSGKKSSSSTAKGVSFLPAIGALGCEMAFCPVMTDPSTKPAEI